MVSLVRWNPVRELTWRSPFFDEFFGAGEDEETWFSPALDVTQDEKGYRLKAELPGVPRENIKIDIDDGVLTISGERSEEKREEGESSILSERWYGKFSRCVRLPDAADTAKAEASYENGVLTVAVPKREEARKRKLEIAVK